MSEGDKSYTSILLPSAGVTLFTTDPETTQSFKALEDDWRFARVHLEIIEGDVDTAIEYYTHNTSPNLIIIQTENIDDGFSDKLESLAQYAAEGTAAMVVGPVNDVNLYRKLIGMGVSDYLVKPLQTEQLGNDIAATLIDQLGETGSRLVAVMGAKGGTGVSALTQGIAWGMADQLGQKTFLLDAAGGWSTLGIGMDFEPTTTLAEAVRAAAAGNEDSLLRMVHQAHDKLFVLSSGGDVMLDDIVDAPDYEMFLDHLLATYPVVIVDLSGAPASIKRTVIARAHKIILVTTPLLPSVRAARTLIQEMKELRNGALDDLSVIANMQGIAPKHEVPKAQIEEGISRKLDIVIPFDPGLFAGTESEGKKLSEDKTGRTILQSLLPLVRKVAGDAGGADEDAGEVIKGKRGLGRFLTKLTAKAQAG